MQFSFARDETPQRLFVLDKIKEFAYSNPTIVQSGDSSGFYGIEPAVVMRHFPPATSYLNMSCCANLGFRGYYQHSRLHALAQPSVRYMVLHIHSLYDATAGNVGLGRRRAMGSPDIKVFGDAVYENFSSAGASSICRRWPIAAR